MRLRNVPLCDQRGFTLVEVMVAALILMVGVLGTFTLLDGASKTQRENYARVQAVNLAREIVEQARSLEYEELAPGRADAAIKPRIDAGGAPATTGWTVERRGVVYTVRLDVCTFDDPKDGLAAETAKPKPPAGSFCLTSPAPVPNAPAESNPDDFRRLEVIVSYKRNGGTGSREVRQTSLIVNPSGGLGPRLALAGPTAQISDPLATSATFTGVSAPAVSLKWTADDGASETVNASGAGTSWSFAWPLGQLGQASSVVDGSFAMSAQAFDSRGIPGEVAVAPVHINRRIPPEVTGVMAGLNPRHGVVDIRWNRSPDQDVQAYRVYRGDGTLVCPAPGVDPLTTECTDTVPAKDYRLQAWDRVDLASPSSSLRGGVAKLVTIGGVGGSPATPSNLQVTTVDGRPRLNWSQSSSADVAFYRIYRGDATGLNRRYDRTLTTDTVWGDQAPGTATRHRYWVTAVSVNMAESNDSNVVEWVRP